MTARKLSHFVTKLVAALSLAVLTTRANAEIVIGISFPSQEGGSTNSSLNTATNDFNPSAPFFLLSPASSFGRTNEVVVVTKPDFGSRSTSQITFGSTTAGAMTVTLIKNTIKFDWPGDHIGWVLQTRTNSSGDPIKSPWVGVDGSSATNHVELTLDRANDSVSFRLVAP